MKKTTSLSLAIAFFVSPASLTACSGKASDKDYDELKMLNGQMEERITELEKEKNENDALINEKDAEIEKLNAIIDTIYDDETVNPLYFYKRYDDRYQEIQDSIAALAERVRAEKEAATEESVKNSLKELEESMKNPNFGSGTDMHISDGGLHAVVKLNVTSGEYVIAQGFRVVRHIEENVELIVRAALEQSCEYVEFRMVHEYGMTPVMSVWINVEQEKALIATILNMRIHFADWYNSTLLDRFFP